ncbi:MAG TPA: BON domain-containing protein [Gaiellaceae bacterium]|nr:BON domain-containing protein [Gaiellaceae bacterium]
MTSASGDRREAGGRLAAGLVAGAVLAFFLDPARGRHRRRLLRERSAGAVRHSARRVGRACRAGALRARGRVDGALHRVRPRRRAPLDDAGLAHKVESMLFRDPHVPKGRLSINAERGAVFLRGEVESAELIDELAAAVRTIPGVREVVNLLHVPGVPAPHPDGRRPRPGGS